LLINLCSVPLNDMQKQWLKQRLMSRESTKRDKASVQYAQRAAILAWVAGGGGVQRSLEQSLVSGSCGRIRRQLRRVETEL
jgi:hypothetical protein